MALFVRIFERSILQTKNTIRLLI